MQTHQSTLVQVCDAPDLGVLGGVDPKLWTRCAPYDCRLYAWNCAEHYTDQLLSVNDVQSRYSNESFSFLPRSYTSPTDISETTHCRPENSDGTASIWKAALSPSNIIMKEQRPLRRQLIVLRSSLSANSPGWLPSSNDAENQSLKVLYLKLSNHFIAYSCLQLTRTRHVKVNHNLPPSRPRRQQLQRRGDLLNPSKLFLSMVPWPKIAPSMKASKAFQTSTTLCGSCVAYIP